MPLNTAPCEPAAIQSKFEIDSNGISQSSSKYVDAESLLDLGLDHSKTLDQKTRVNSL